MRRLILPTASRAVFGVNLAVPTARDPDYKLEQFIAQEDQSRRPTLRKAETRQFLVAAQPFLSAPVRYSLAEIVAIMARGERAIAPERPAGGDAPAASAADARARGRSGQASGDAPAAGRRPRPGSTDVRGHRLRFKTASAAARAAVGTRTGIGESASSSGAPPAEDAAAADVGTEPPVPTGADQYVAADVSGDAPATEAPVCDRSGRHPLPLFSREQVVSRDALAAASLVLEQALTEEPIEGEEPTIIIPSYAAKAHPWRQTAKRPASRSAGGPPATRPRMIPPAPKQRPRPSRAPGAVLPAPVETEECMWIQSDDEGHYYPFTDPATRPTQAQLEGIRIRSEAISARYRAHAPRPPRPAQPRPVSSTPAPRPPPRGAVGAQLPRQWVSVGEEREAAPRPSGSSTDPPPKAAPPAQPAARGRRPQRHERATIEYSSVDMPPPNRFVMYEDAGIPPLWKRLIREAGRRRFAVAGRWRPADPGWVLAGQEGRWFYSRGPVEG